MELFKKLLILGFVGISCMLLNGVNNKNDVSNQIKKNKNDTIDLIQKAKEIKEEDLEVIEEPVIEEVTLYHGLTKEQIIDKSSRMLNSTLSGTSEVFVNYSIEKNVDPLLSIAIVLQETGCYWNCSSLVNNHNNVGGMMGYGGYMSFPTLDEGIKSYINNISNNYASLGLTTAELMHSKYAADPLWASRVNAYIEKIKAA